MFKTTKAFSSFSVNNLDKAKEFYGQTLGLDVSKTDEGLDIKLAGGGSVFLYPKPNHEPASFTVLNFIVADIVQTVDALATAGVNFEHYEGEIKTDEKGIHHGPPGPSIAWFKDPSGNILSVVKEN